MPQNASIQRATAKAHRNWLDQDRPDRFVYTDHIDTECFEGPVNVVVYHHETFLSGAVACTVDFRAISDDDQGDPTLAPLITRMRFSEP